MDNPLNKRELVAMFMESPFYFDLYLRERLMLVQRHQRRLSLKADTPQVRPHQVRPPVPES